MSRLDVRVYIESDYSAIFPADRQEMKTCPACGNQYGVYVKCENQANGIGFSLSGERFDKVIWDNWKCIGCNHQWVERYGVRDGK